MRIEAFATSPNQLVVAIDKAMNAASLKTWKLLKDGGGNVLYTHTPNQWNEEAFIQPQARPDRIIFAITPGKGKPTPTKETEGYYLGRFTEILLVHFRNYFTKLETHV